jgi:hypothetical protein
LFIKQLRGEAPKVKYYINGRQYNLPYYLADCIYPEWTVFVKSITGGQLFSQKQQGNLQSIMLSCIIIHNMIIDDERDIEQVPLDLNEEANTYSVKAATIIS